MKKSFVDDVIAVCEIEEDDICEQHYTKVETEMQKYDADID